MRILLILAGLTMMAKLTNAQKIQTPEHTDLSPGTQRVRVNVISADKEKARVFVLEVLGFGQGTTNPLAIGDTIVIGVQSKPLARNRHNVVMDLKEKLSADASNSDFILIDVKDNK
ncbi:MAG TPA: hypothetical protein VGD40_13055 [Chryseosolibacter sp.]